FKVLLTSFFTLDFYRTLRAGPSTSGRAETPAEIRLHVAETDEQSTGPFDPGDTAALFEVEKAPISLVEMEPYFRRASYNRADLLALVQGMDTETLDWEPAPGDFTIRRILRHVGNADEWYLSRLVEPGTLPPAWENDDKMPLFEFLEMSRRTAIERFRKLTGEERARVAVPTHFTSNPTEQWTARKALRRMLEHEREHTAHIREVLARWRARYLARLAAGRGYFLWQFVGLDEETLTTHPVFENWTPKDMLAHTGEWDEFHTDRMTKAAAGRGGELIEIKSAAFFAERNAEFHAAHQNLTVEQALDRCLSARRSFLDALAEIPDPDLHRQRAMPWGEQISLPDWIKWRHIHDSAHGGEIREWRKENAIRWAPGPKAILLAVFRAARDEILALVSLIPEGERAARLVCGEWTLKDVIGHLTDWELAGVERARLALDGVTSPAMDDLTGDFEAWNKAHAAARRPQPWEQVWADFDATRRDLISIVEQLTREDLERPFTTPWGKTVYEWLVIWPGHEREHAAGLWEELGLPKRMVFTLK
ncbi:MAG: DinB family protein, partial [Anaerolineales bacterium]